MTERYSDYDQWAWLYNETAGPEYRDHQLDFIQRALLPAMKPNGHILDLCCGTGQIMQPLIELGYSVTGLDGSESMLKFAKCNAPKANVLLADARTFTVSEKFDGAISTSASLNHIPTIEDLKQVFQQVAKSLNSEAPFIFDINQPKQMAAHWRGQAAEGELNTNYGWLITPNYNSSEGKGYFKVDIYEAQDTKLNSLKAPLFKLLGLRRLTGARLRLLKQFKRIQPSWKHKELTYSVIGHDLAAVKAALEETGFTRVSIQDAEGNEELSHNSSAHFVCYRAKEEIKPANSTDAVAEAS